MQVRILDLVTYLGMNRNLKHRRTVRRKNWHLYNTAQGRDLDYKEGKRKRLAYELGALEEERLVAQEALLGTAGLLQEDWLTRIRLDLIWKLDLVLLPRPRPRRGVALLLPLWELELAQVAMVSWKPFALSTTCSSSARGRVRNIHLTT